MKETWFQELGVLEKIPTHTAMRFKLGQTVVRDIKLLNIPGGRKWSIFNLRQNLSVVEKET